MRHQLKRHRIARSHAHRKATLAALSTALIKHKRIKTTLSKAKALRVYVEPILNRGKEDTTHNRREVFRHLQDKYAVTELFSEISPKIVDRSGGYTRVIKLGARPGDAAEMAVIELVDYNDVKPGGATGTRRRRTRRGGGAGRGTAPATTSAPAAASAPAAEPTPAVEPTPEPVEAAELEPVSDTPDDASTPASQEPYTESRAATHEGPMDPAEGAREADDEEADTPDEEKKA
jgi:large subunit ribosomal protein L17